MKTTRKGTNAAIAANLAEHKRRMDAYMQAGKSRDEASALAYADMRPVKRVTAADIFSNPKRWMNP